MKKFIVKIIVSILFTIFIKYSSYSFVDSNAKNILQCKETSNSYKIYLLDNINFKYNQKDCFNDSFPYHNELIYNEINLHFKLIKGIKNKLKYDSIFLLPPINDCEDGYSYYFTNLSIPRIVTESYCCMLNNLFVVDDIDEDGISEIGLLESSCVTRYKKLSLYSLVNNKWKVINSCTFDVDSFVDTNIDYEGYFGLEKYIEKVSKNKFRMNEKSIIIIDSMKIVKDNWLYFQIQK